MTTRRNNNMPVMKSQCKTCPFRPGTPFHNTETHIAIQQRALDKASHICHTTDTHICRGCRDFQLQIFYRLGVIDAETDEAWERKWKEVREK